MTSQRKPATYTVTYSDGTITKIDASGPLQAAILAAAAAIMDDKTFVVATVKSEGGAVYAIDPMGLVLR